ncbi:MAG: ComF family protein [Pseudomonadota bacterium]
MHPALKFLFPEQCVSCSAEIEDPGLCPSCWGSVTFIGEAACASCGAELVGEDVRPGDLCDGCHKNPMPWDLGRAAIKYDGKGRELVLRLKHGDRLDLAGPLAGWLARAARPMVVPGMVVAPVPLHWRRLLKRGFNQAVELSRPMARELGLIHYPDLLQRKLPSKEKAGSSEVVPMVGTFALSSRREDALAGMSVLLVDDVMTTGATLAACTEICRAAGATTVCVAALARARPRA